MEEPNPPEKRNVNTGGGNYNERIEGDYIQGNFFKRTIISIFRWTINIFVEQTTTPVGDPARPKNERILLTSVKEEIIARLRQSLHNAVLINLGKESQPQQVKRPWDAEIKIGLKPAVPLPDTTTILSVFESEEIAGKLLILGAPGSGKTTTQLELAQELIKKAEEQPEYPVPVLFNLSSWKDDRQPLTDWLVAELKSKYGVSNKLGKEWVDNHQLLPLLDGLDELESQRQELRVRAINQSLTGVNRPRYLVVCSRSEEYNHYYPTRLQLNSAIVLKPLNTDQIHDYLRNIKYLELWSTISSDLDLLELLKTPLFLSITVIASQEISVEEWQHLTSTKDRIKYLLNAYVRRMLKRDTNSRAYLKKKTPNDTQTQMLLVWLTQQMERESKTEFLIEEMQPSLLNLIFQKNIYNFVAWGFIGSLISGLTTGMMSGVINELFDKLAGVLESDMIKSLSYGLISGLISGLITSVIRKRIENKIENLELINSQTVVQIRNIKLFTNGLVYGLINWMLYVLANGNGLAGGLSFGLPYALISGLSYGLIGDEIKTIDKIKFSLKNYFKGMKNGVVIGMVTGVVIGMVTGVIRVYSEVVSRVVEGLLGVVTGVVIGGLQGVFIALFIGAILAVFFGLIIGFIYGIDGQEIEKKTVPNQGIYQSAINTIIITSIICIPVAPLMFFIRLWFIKPANGLSPTSELSFIYPLVFGVFLGLFIAIPKSGTPAIKHLVLRVILWSNGYIPWNYARFLNYCTDRLFLQRVGGRYRFIHKLLQDHFAQMEFKRN